MMVVACEGVATTAATALPGHSREMYSFCCSQVACEAALQFSGPGVVVEPGNKGRVTYILRLTVYWCVVMTVLFHRSASWRWSGTCRNYSRWMGGLTRMSLPDTSIVLFCFSVFICVVMATVCTPVACTIHGYTWLTFMASAVWF